MEQKPSLRRSAIVLLIGTIATLAGLMTARATSTIEGIVVGVLALITLYRVLLFLERRR